MLASAIANGTGVSLLFFTFSMFLLPIAAELHLSRGDVGKVQSLIVTAALGAPVIGRLTDLHGFRRVFAGCTVIMGAIQLGLAQWTSGLGVLALGIALTGVVGAGNSTVTITRPVNAHFHRARGLALGLVGAGVSLTTILVPPLLQLVIDGWGWRKGMAALATISVAVGLPLVMLIMPRAAATARTARQLSPAGAPSDRSALRERDFWLLALAHVLANMATSGAVSQLAPMIHDEGLTTAVAAYGLSAFAAGQLLGKLGGGWLLDKAEPRLVAVILTVVPASGFIMLLLGSGAAGPALAAAALIGLLQGADIGIFAYFVARRFGVARYGSTFGALHGLGWIGTALGIIAFGSSYNRFASYAPAQGGAVLLLIAAALLFIPIRLQPLTPKGAN